MTDSPAHGDTSGRQLDRDESASDAPQHPRGAAKEPAGGSSGQSKSGGLSTPGYPETGATHARQRAPHAEDVTSGDSAPYGETAAPDARHAGGSLSVAGGSAGSALDRTDTSEPPRTDEDALGS